MILYGKRSVAVSTNLDLSQRGRCLTVADGPQARLSWPEVHHMIAPFTQVVLRDGQAAQSSDRGSPTVQALSKALSEARFVRERVDTSQPITSQAFSPMVMRQGLTSGGRFRLPSPYDCFVYSFCIKTISKFCVFILHHDHFESSSVAKTRHRSHKCTVVPQFLP